MSFYLFFCIGCEIWSPTLREEHRLRVSENGILRIILLHPSPSSQAQACHWDLGCRWLSGLPRFGSAGILVVHRRVVGTLKRLRACL